MSPHRSDLWPPEREARLLKLAPTVPRVMDLAAALGTTRGAIVGKMARMRRSGTIIQTNFKHVRQPKPKTEPRMVTKPKPQSLPQPPEPVVVFTMRRLSLLELGPRTCRWPVGDGPPYLFCGNDTEPEQSYCPVHRIAAHHR
jgi:hypothetical protein